MLQESMLGKLYSIWLNSYTFYLLFMLYHWIGNLCSNSFVVQFITRDSRLEQLYADSLFSRIVNAIGRAILNLAGIITNGFLRLNSGSVNERLIGNQIKSSRLLRLESLLGIFFLLMFATPHSNWSNSYALLSVVALLLVYFLLCTVGVKQPVKLSELGIPLLLFAVACVISLVSSYYRSDSLRVLIFYITAFLLIYVITAIITDTKKLMVLLGFVYAIVFITGSYGVVQNYFGVAVNASYTDLAANVGVPGRVFSSLDNPNNFAEVLVIFTPLAAAFAATRKNTVARILLSCGVAVPVIALVMTYSRSCWVSAILAIAVFVYFSNKKLIPAAILVGLIAIPFLPGSVITRFSTLLTLSDASSKFRIKIWTGVIELLKNHLPSGIGLGPYSFAIIYQRFAIGTAKAGVAHSHMVYMELLVETGVFGFLSFMWYYLRQIKNTAVALHRTVDRQLKTALIAGVSSLVGIAFAFGVEYVWYYPRTMFSFFILMGICAASLRIQKQEQIAVPEN